MVVAGEETNESLSAWLRAAAAAHQSSESERGASETDKNARGAEECSGRQEDSAEGVVVSEARISALLGRFFSHIILWKIPFLFIFLLFSFVSSRFLISYLSSSWDPWLVLLPRVYKPVRLLVSASLNQPIDSIFLSQ